MTSPVLSIHLDENSELRDYVFGEENRLAVSAAEALSENRMQYNPLVFYGPPGVGKSLLLHGLNKRWKADHAESRTLLSTGADFARQYADALETKSLEDLRRRNRQTSLLAIDDLHHLNEKQAAQQEFSQTLDVLLEQQRWVLVTLRQAPCDTPHLAPGLASRLSSGLTIPLIPPGPEVRRLLLERILHLQNATADEQTLDWIIEHSPADQTVPQLRHLALQLLHSGPINLEAARRYFSEQQDQQEPALKSIVQVVGRHFRIKTKDLLGPSRKRPVVAARGVAILLARRLTKCSLEQIGKHFGKRDHTTILHACRQTEQNMENDPEIRQALEQLEERFA